MDYNSRAQQLMVMEQQFLKEFQATPFFREYVDRYGEPPDISPRSDYDYRAWWRDGFRGMARMPDGTIHGPSKDSNGNWLKAPNHPTHWKQDYIDKWGLNPDEIGASNLGDLPALNRLKAWRGAR